MGKETEERRERESRFFKAAQEAKQSGYKRSCLSATSIAVLPSQPLETMKVVADRKKDYGICTGPFLFCPQLPSLARRKWPVLMSLASQERNDCPGFEQG